MGKQQKKWSAEFKLEVVLAVLHGEVAAAEIARQRGIHETLVHKWKRQFLEAGRQSFEDQRAVNAKEVRLEKELEREGQAIAILRAQQVDGMLIFPVQHDNLRHIEVLRETGYPIVLLAGRHITNADLVAMDDVLGAYQATRYLITLGHRRIAFFEGGAEKLEGYQLALKDHGLPLDSTLIIESEGSNYEHGYHAAPALFQLKLPPKALLATTDYLALGTIAWCKTHHFNVPEQLAVIGFDDIEAAKYSDSTLSSVTYDAANISVPAVNRLLELIMQAQTPSQEQHTEKTIVAPKLTIRQSTGSLVVLGHEQVT